MILRNLDPRLLECDHRPLSGGAPPFPFEEIAEGLGHLFALSSSSVTAHAPEWRTEKRLTGGLGSNPLILPLEFSPIEPPFFLLFPPKEVEKLLFLTTKERESAAALDEGLRGGLLRFVITGAMELLEETGYPAPNLRLSNSASLPEEPGLAIDFQWTAERRKVKGRLLLPASFHTDWCRHFATRPPSPSKLKNVSVRLHIEAGETELSAEEWKQVVPGDLLLLDHFDRGQVKITSGGIEIARGQTEEGGVRIDGEPDPFEEEEEVEDGE